MSVHPTHKLTGFFRGAHDNEIYNNQLNEADRSSTIVYRSQGPSNVSPNPARGSSDAPQSAFVSAGFFQGATNNKLYANQKKKIEEISEIVYEPHGSSNMQTMSRHVPLADHTCNVNARYNGEGGHPVGDYSRRAQGELPTQYCETNESKKDNKGYGGAFPSGSDLNVDTVGTQKKLEKGPFICNCHMENDSENRPERICVHHLRISKGSKHGALHANHAPAVESATLPAKSKPQLRSGTSTRSATH